MPALPNAPDGYVVRTAGEADVPAIAALYRGLSEHSARMRFSAPVAPSLLARIAALPPDRAAVSLLAESAGQVVAEARYEVHGDGAPELSLTVADAHQGKGLGRLLLQRLRVAARECGVESLLAVVRTDNVPMLRLLQSLGYAVVEPAADGVVCVEVATDAWMPGWPGGSEGSRVLLESPGWWATPETAALEAAGFTVRQCPGPGGAAGRPCALLAEGRCRLVEGADVVACLLVVDPSGESPVRTVEQWRERVRELVRTRRG
ncbi:MAG: GNAT family N-acetyltransferase [Actinomycetota bacterium]